VLLLLDHHGHPIGGGGDEDLDPELVVVGHGERGRDSEVSYFILLLKVSVNSALDFLRIRISLSL
jgi:hypothetical protein